MMPHYRQAALLLPLLLLFAESARAEALLSRHPYPQMATQQSVAIVWRTVGGSTPIVRYGTSPEQLDSEVLPVQIVVRLGPDVQGPVGLPRLHSAPPDTYQYEASIFGLQPGTTYYYGVYDNDRLLAGEDLDHSFTTLPTSDSTGPLRLWVVGDSGNGSAAQIAGFEAMRDFVTNDGKQIDAYLHLGDMAYNVGADGEFSANFFDIYTELLRNTVVWPTMGNHEGVNSSGATQVGPYYDSYVMPTEGEAGGMPSGTEAYYSFDIGRVHFICLDSHDLDRSPTGEMALWLKSDLEMADADWLIAFWHHPPYTKGTHDSDREFQLVQMREFMMPILESGGVDLVLAGHSHVYERSMLIDGAYATPTVADGVILDDGDGMPSGNGAYRKSAALNPHEGTVAVVAGHGRSAAIRFGRSPVMRSVVAEVGSVILDIDGDTLTGKMINSSGLVRDEFQLIKRGEVIPEVVEFPWQAVGPSFRQERRAPGETTIEIEANPLVPDAVIYYTLDGSVPTTDSPVYSDPIPISDTATVRAISYWRGDELMSLVSESVPMSPLFSLQTYVESAGDDGRQEVSGQVELDGESFGFGDGGMAGVRFADVNLSKDVYIHRAAVQFSKRRDASVFGSSGLIWGELVADSQPFSGADSEFGDRPPTAATVFWNVFGWNNTSTRDAQSRTPDLSEIVREIVAQPAWQPGQAMSFFFTQTQNLSAEAYESGRAKAASLIVIYIEADQVIEDFATQSLAIFPASEGGYLIFYRAPDSAAIEELGLSYQIEGSADLQRWDPIEPDAVGFGSTGEDGYREALAVVGAGQLLGESEYYFRIRVSKTPVEP